MRKLCFVEGYDYGVNAFNCKSRGKECLWYISCYNILEFFRKDEVRPRKLKVACRYLVLSAQPNLLNGISDDSRAVHKGDEVPLGSI